MSQFDFGTIDPNVKTGTQLAADLNQWRTALHSTHAGVSRPAYALPGMLWVEQASGTDWRLKLATPTGDVLIGSMNPATNVPVPTRFPDGTLAAPAISWANEPAAGFYRASAGQFRYAVGGADVIGITATTFSTGTGIATVLGSSLSVAGVTNLTGALGVGNFINSAAITVTGAAGPQHPSAPSATLFNAGLTVNANPSANTYPNLILNVRHSNSSQAAVYQWAHVTAGTGQHIFSNLTSPHGAQPGVNLFFTGPKFGGSGLGVCMFPRYSSADLGGKMEWEYSAATPATTTWRVAIARQGSISSAGDLVVQVTPYNIPQTIVYGGMPTSLSNIQSNALVIASSDPGVPMAGLCFKSYADVYTLFTFISGAFYWGTEGGPGPAGGWAMTCTPGGAVTAGSFNPVSDAKLKKEVRPIENALANVLRLKGVRFRRVSDNGEDMGMIAQDVRGVYPEVVGVIKPPPDDEEVLTVNYNALMGPMVEALRELTQRVTKLETT